MPSAFCSEVDVTDVQEWWGETPIILIAAVTVCCSCVHLQPLSDAAAEAAFNSASVAAHDGCQDSRELQFHGAVNPQEVN